MASKGELERELILCKGHIQTLEAQLEQSNRDKEAQYKQIDRLQEALFSVRAPEAYKDKVFNEQANLSPVDPETEEKNRVYKTVTERYLNSLEGPLFRDGNDIDDLLTTGILKDFKAPASIHGNNES